MTIEDRLRATTEAVTEAMHPVRPLDLRSGAAADPAPAKYRRPRRRVRWSGWLIPLAAAMAVIAVAATLVAVRSLPGAGPGSPPAPASPRSSGLPRYYVAAGLMGRDGTPTQNAVLADASTGKQLATFSPPNNMFFVYIAAAADDATFVLLARPLGPGTPKAGQPSYIWYVLRLSPGAPQRAKLTRVPIPALTADTVVIGLSVSPDGRTLAALFQVTSYVGGKKAAAYHLMMRTYSLATGQALRTWSEPDGPLSPTGPGTFNVSWLNDGRTLAFAAATRTAPVEVRFLNTTSPGANLAADSRPVFSPPAGGACGSLLLTADGKVAVCGGYAPDASSCAKGQLDVTAYSVATGKLERVLYRYRGGCQPSGTVNVMWAGPGPAAVGAVFVGSAKENRIGLMTPGKFTPLPIVSTGSAYDPGSIAF